MYEIKIVREFSAAHRVEDYPGNCERLHGHNWKVEVAVRTAELDSLGMVMDFRKLKEIADHALEALDHRLLNDTPPFDTINPTAEHIARHLFGEIARHAPVSRVTVYETESSAATYCEE